MKRFSVQALPAPATADRAAAVAVLAATLSAGGAGTVEADGDVLVPTEAVRRLAGRPLPGEEPAAGPDWQSEFGAMLDFAATRGWITDDGSIRVHVEWVD